TPDVLTGLESPDAPTLPPEAPATPLPASDRRRIMAYFVVMALTIGVAAPYGGLFDIPISFVLKNKLHLSAHDVANFRFWVAVPLYLSFAFGFARDMWNPLGMRDRGYFVLFGAMGAVVFAGFAFAPAAFSVSYAGLVIAVVAVTIAFNFLWAAWTGLSAML